ncbi:TPA: efflux RND transporter periplasmic adaptor subunit, partial [Burkholderia cenocepacia]
MKNQKRCCYGAVCALVGAMLAGCGPSEQPAAAPATPVAAMTVA